MMTKPHIRYVGPHWVCFATEKLRNGASLYRSAPGINPSKALSELEKLCPPMTNSNKYAPAP